jgi:hypothetical protein
MHNAKERALRASRAAARKKAALGEGLAVKPKPFKVLVAIHRPRYRARMLRGITMFDWEVRSLLNKEDPIGILNQHETNILVLSDDFGRNRELGFFKAAQRFRPQGVHIVGVFDTEEDANAASGLYDMALYTPWKSLHAQEILAELFQRIKGEPPHIRNDVVHGEIEEI